MLPTTISNAAEEARIRSMLTPENRYMFDDPVATTAVWMEHVLEATPASMATLAEAARMQFRAFDDLEEDEQSYPKLNIDVLTLPFRNVPEFDAARREILENGPGDSQRRRTLLSQGRGSQSRLSTLLQDGVKRYHDRAINRQGEGYTDASRARQSHGNDAGDRAVGDESEEEGREEGGSTKSEEGVTESSYGPGSSGQAWKLL